MWGSLLTLGLCPWTNPSDHRFVEGHACTHQSLLFGVILRISHMSLINIIKEWNNQARGSYHFSGLLERPWWLCVALRKYKNAYGTVLHHSFQAQPNHFSPLHFFYCLDSSNTLSPIAEGNLSCGRHVFFHLRAGSQGRVTNCRE